MEQTKNESTKENKAAPDAGKPKKEREPLTEAQRLKRQKMIVLPAMVLVFIGAMWLIFAPSSGKEQPPGTDGYNTEMPDADKANRQIIGDKLKAYEHGEMEERLESRNRAIGQLGDMFDREIAGTEDGTDFDLANPGGKEERAKPATPQTIQSSAAAYRDLNATTSNLIERTSEMLKTNSVSIQQQAASSTVSIEALQKAFANIYQTMDSIDSFKLEALNTMSQTVGVLETEVAKSRAYLDRARQADERMSVAGGLTAPPSFDLG